MSIRSRILKVGAAKSLEMVIVTVIRFFSVPLFLIAWSPELYGEWLILYSLLTYVNLGKLGFAQATANQMTMFIAREDRDSALATYQTTIAVILVIITALIAVGMVVVWLLPLGHWLGLEFIGEDDVRLILLCFVAYVAIGFMNGLFMAGYRCEGRYHRGIVYYNGVMLTEFGAMATLLLLGFGPLAVATSMLGVRVAGVLVLFVDLRFVVPWALFGVGQANRTSLKRIITPSLSFAAFPAAQTVINQGVVIGIGVIIGPLAVVLFNSLRTLTNMVTRVFDLVNQAFYPEVSIAFGQGKFDLLRRLHRLSCHISIWLGLLVVAFLAALGPWIFDIWTRGLVPLDLPFFWGCIGLVTLRSLWYTSYIVPAGINRHQRLTVTYLITSALGLGISVALLKVSLFLGLTGFVFSELVMVFFVVGQSLRITTDRVLGFICAIMIPPNPTVVFQTILAPFRLKGKSK